jgi:hypothetical protein
MTKLDVVIRQDARAIRATVRQGSEQLCRQFLPRLLKITMHAAEYAAHQVLCRLKKIDLIKTILCASRLFAEALMRWCFDTLVR